MHKRSARRKTLSRVMRAITAFMRGERSPEPDAQLPAARVSRERHGPAVSARGSASSRRAVPRVRAARSTKRAAAARSGSGSVWMSATLENPTMRRTAFAAP